jgi:flagellar biosynthetic protein FliQ
MTQGEVMEILQGGLLVALKLTAPLLIVSIVVGLIIAIFQAATQIHEQTLTFVPKLFAIAMVLLLLGSWMMTVMNDYVNQIFARLATI